MKGARGNDDVEEEEKRGGTKSSSKINDLKVTVTVFQVRRVFMFASCFHVCLLH